MDKQTLKALKGSIRKWRNIERGVGVDKGEDNCPLCELDDKKGGDFCTNCIIFKKTKEMGCANTPFTVWENHQREKHLIECFVRRVRCPICKSLATKEREFLESLLPRRKPAPKKKRKYRTHGIST